MFARAVRTSWDWAKQQDIQSCTVMLHNEFMHDIQRLRDQQL